MFFLMFLFIYLFFFFYIFWKDMVQIVNMKPELRQPVAL